MKEIKELNISYEIKEINNLFELEINDLNYKPSIEKKEDTGFKLSKRRTLINQYLSINNLLLDQTYIYYSSIENSKVSVANLKREPELGHIRHIVKLLRKINA